MVPNPRQGTFPLFKFKGIQVSLHWSWLLVAWWQIHWNQDHELYSSPIWSVLQYLALFGIVLLHEFGHAFATRQAGGSSENIMLWPFGGIAYVKVPPRPGALLWGIAAGPLVNVALFPLFWLLSRWGDSQENDSLANFLYVVHLINFYLLLFNILPVYPLDGGQILQALLWFKFGYARALQVASAIGLAGGCALTAWMLIHDDSVSDALFSLLLGSFIISTAWRSFQASRKFLAEQPPAGQPPAGQPPAEQPPAEQPPAGQSPAGI